MDKFSTTEFCVLVDNREQIPYRFTGLKTDVSAGSRDILVRQRTCFLSTADYSIENLTDQVAVERKSIDDLFSTLGNGRARFVRELERLQEIKHATVCVEAGWSEILDDPPSSSRLLPKTIFRSIVAWQQQFPNVHWNFLPNRRTSEIFTFRFLERFHRQLKKAASPVKEDAAQQQ